MDDGITKFMRDMYGYSKYQRPTWEMRLDIYDALYKIDPTMHLKYLYRKMERITKDIVVEDVRYISEIKDLHEQGFIILRIATPEMQRRRHMGKALRDAANGTLLLSEHFYNDKTAGYNADYVILNETREKTRQALDKLLDEMRIEGV
jgi:dephospho-CoA kinase